MRYGTVFGVKQLGHKMKIYIIADTHFNHDEIATYCQRPADFTQQIIKNCRHTLQPTDHVFHLGDVFIGKYQGWDEIRTQLPGTWHLVRGNHDKKHSPTWWLDHGFASVCDSMIFRGAWLTHHPARFLPQGCDINIHGHLHNIWHGFHRNAPSNSPENQTWARKRLHNPWQRLFAIEYTNYRPVEFEKFVSHADKYQARGPVDGTGR